MFRRKTQSDKEAVLQILAGDREAYVVLVERYLRQVHALAFAKTGNRADAEDVAQEAFVRGLEKLPHLRDRAKFGPWILAITRNVAGNTIRSARAERSSLEKFARLSERTASPDLERRDIHAFLREGVMGLEDGPREVLLLHYFAGNSAREIATLLGISREAAKKRLQRAKEALSKNVLTEIGPAFETNRPTKENVTKIMGVVAGVSLASQAAATAPIASASFATGTAILGGMFAMKKMIAVGLILLIGMLGLYGWLDDDERAVAPAPTDTAALSLEPLSDGNDSAVGEESRIDQPTADDPETAESELVEAAGLVAPSEAEETSSEEFASVEGRVVDAWGNPVPNAGVSVHVTGLTYGDTGKDARFVIAKAMSDLERHYTTKTDLLGRFRVDDIAHFGITWVSASGEGFQGREILELTPGKVEKDIEIVVKQGVPLTGRILSPSMTPVEGAVVFSLAFVTDGSAHGGGMDNALSDRKGVFELIYEREGYATVLVVTETYGQHQFQALPVGNEEIIDLVLKEPGVLEGTVVYPQGEPATGTHVLLSSWVDLSLGRSSVSAIGLQHYATTNDEGMYRIAKVAPDVLYQVSVETPDFESLSQPMDIGPFNSGEIKTWDHVIEALATVEGHVIGDPSGASLDGVKVHLKEGGDTLHGGTVSVEAGGAYRIETAAAPGTYVLAPRYAYSNNAHLAHPFDQAVQLYPGAHVEMDLPMPDPFSISILVVNEQDEPLPSAELSIQFGTRHRDTTSYGQIGTTDEAGRFTIGGLDPSVTYWLDVFAEGYFKGTSMDYPGEVGAVFPEETIVLHAPSGIEGVALDPQGQPLALAELVVRAYQGGERVATLRLNTTDQGYFFSEDSLPATVLSIEIEYGDETGDLEWGSGPIEMSPDRPFDLGAIILEAAPNED